MTYQDKTPSDEKVANIVSDYHNFTNVLMDLAKKKGATETEIDAILDMQSKSSHPNGERRTYRDLVDERFDITKVIRIERSADKNDIANKWCDFSLGTIKFVRPGNRRCIENSCKESKDIKKYRRCIQRT